MGLVAYRVDEVVSYSSHLAKSCETFSLTIQVASVHVWPTSRLRVAPFRYTTSFLLRPNTVLLEVLLPLTLPHVAWVSRVSSFERHIIISDSLSIDRM